MPYVLFPDDGIKKLPKSLTGDEDGSYGRSSLVRKTANISWQASYHEHGYTRRLHESFCRLQGRPRKCSYILMIATHLALTFVEADPEAKNR